MEELPKQRVNFVQKVQSAVSGDILKNGLALESVSLMAGLGINGGDMIRLTGVVNTMNGKEGKV